MNPQPKSKIIRLSRYMLKKLQKEVLTRDNFTCQNPECRARTQNAPHHIVYKSHAGSDTMENLITLCGPLENNCHRKLHDHKIKLDLP